MSTTPTPQITANIRAELGRQNKTRAALAREMGVTEMWLSRRVNAQTPFTVDDLATIAAALDVPMADLLPTEASA